MMQDLFVRFSNQKENEYEQAPSNSEEEDAEEDEDSVFEAESDPADNEDDIGSAADLPFEILTKATISNVREFKLERGSLFGIGGSGKIYHVTVNAIPHVLKVFN